MSEDKDKAEALRWMPSGYLRQFQPKDGAARLEQLWEGVATGEKEWRPVPTVLED